MKAKEIPTEGTIIGVDDDEILDYLSGKKIKDTPEEKSTTSLHRYACRRLRISQRSN